MFLYSHMLDRTINGRDFLYNLRLVFLLSLILFFISKEIYNFKIPFVDMS